ncbi:hypothetical protein [Rhizobium paknamense]|uniref:Phage-Barnase-EndoU-ColicinE5/D-RelE like nuclease 3 domain-containing protein n=1 Tax=Rhizobium paknamense TaxID=1206817 RepID=A0ABU0II77_9HYPH|nr:hypothetical protein [Rhizobium paknamense]MDQ0457967.1 hypothetical protein [Rhizobium paknamense]
MSYNRLTQLKLGPLPVEHLKKFGIVAAPGEVIFTVAAQKHAIKGHAQEFALCLRYIERAVQSPTYVGQGPQHKNRGVELIYEHVIDKVIILVAIHLEKTEHGLYIVKSTYPISKDKLERRVRKKFLIATK